MNEVGNGKKTSKRVRRLQQKSVVCSLHSIVGDLRCTYIEAPGSGCIPCLPVLKRASWDRRKDLLGSTTKWSKHI